MNLMRTHKQTKQQRGAAFLVMLVILIMGVTFYLVSALNKVTMQTARNEKSADILAQAKEVVIGDMLRHTGSARPGEMMFPDVLSNTANEPNYDGVSESGCFDSTASANYPSPYTPLIQASTVDPQKLLNMRCLGRLPWKSLGMSIGGSPSENDPTGFMPWYAFSRNLVNPNQPINSELLNTPASPWLKVYDMKGNLLSDRVAFVIIIPGPTLPNQSRPPSPSLKGPDQYLDSISFPPGCVGAACIKTYKNYDLSETFVTGDEHRWMDDPANPGKQIEDPTYQFNDKLLYVTIDELMPLIEKRIAREVKACLDDYANAPSNTKHLYPWAALVSDTNDPRPGTYNVLFGRMPETPNTSTTLPGTPPSEPLLTYLNDVQTALNNYLANPNSSTLSALRSKGDVLKDHTSSGTAAHTAGTIADGCTSSSCDTSTLQDNLNTALGLGAPSSGMPTTWASVPSCNQLINISSYWPDWRDLVFYQVADGFQPTGGGSCTTGTTCLSVSGTGNTNSGNGTYHAAVIVAGKWLAGQSTRPVSNTPPNSAYANNYLESGNNHQSAAGATPSVSFTTYKPSDTTNYSTVNDLAICLDGKINCK